jgi:hypothetical protein
MNLPLSDGASETRPEIPAEYQVLRDRLTAQDWQGADQETRRLLGQWIGDMYSSTPTAHTIPVEAIQTIDRLWAEASNGRFGLLVQQRIWEEVLVDHPNGDAASVEALGDRLGWTRTTPSDDLFISPDWLTEPELTFSLDAPEGHLPWAGVSWSTVSGILSQQSCGSCTIDAMYLQGERFHRYVPSLMERVKTVLGYLTSAPTTNS